MKKTPLKITLLIYIGISTIAAGQLFADECSTIKARFINNKNGTINDRKTGLNWMTCPIGLSGKNCKKGQLEHFTWLSALNLGLESTFNQKNDWRLPKRSELLSLVETNCIGIRKVAIDTNAFPNTPDGFFWSSSKRQDNSSLTQAINFSDGLDYEKDRFQYYYVRLVRNTE